MFCTTCPNMYIQLLYTDCFYNLQNDNHIIPLQEEKSGTWPLTHWQKC